MLADAVQVQLPIAVVEQDRQGSLLGTVQVGFRDRNHLELLRQLLDLANLVGSEGLRLVGDQDRIDQLLHGIPRGDEHHRSGIDYVRITVLGN